MRLLIVVLYPFVWIFGHRGRLLSPRERQPTVSRIELTTLAAIGEQEGTLRARERRVVHSLLGLGATRVADVMTPRTVVAALPQTMTVGQVVADHGVLPHSRVPVFGDTIDDVTGYVLRHDILTATSADEHDTPLADLRQDIGVVPEALSVAQALERLVAEREHIFLVVDEFGGTAGIVTLEDTIETLLGSEILDESDAVEDLREVAQQRRRLLVEPDAGPVPTAA